MRKVATIACLAIIAATGAVSAEETATIDAAAATGIRLETRVDPADPMAVHCTVEWLRSSDAATIRSTGVVELIAAEALTPAPMAVTAGDRHEVTLVLDGRDTSEPAAVVVERTDGDTVFQAIVTVQTDGTTTRTMPQINFRVDHHRLDDGGGVINVEHLGPKLATTGTVNGADTMDRDIPDGPTDCGSGSTTWPMTTFISISGAPAGATATAVSLHLEVVHPVMSDLQIVQSKGFYSVARFLWNNGAGTNLSRTYTTDIYGHALAGVGEEVNGTWVLAARDCWASDVGYVDRWSLEIDYDDGGGNDIDLEADYVVLDPSSVEDGDQVEVSWRGEVTGADPVGGNFTVGHYLSADTNITTSDTLLSSAVVSSAQNPGDDFGQWSPGQMITIPGGTSAGTYYLGMIIDTGDDVAETDEGNNRAWDQLEVTNGGGGGGGGGGGQANLAAMPCSMQTIVVAPSDNVVIGWRAFNLGDAGTGPFDYGIYFSEDDSIDPATDTRLWGESVADWPAGYDSDRRGNVLTLPPGTVDGTYLLGLALDTNDSVAESSEYDNTCQARFMVTSTGEPYQVTRWLVPAVASAPGFGTSNWKSQVAVVNPHNVNRTASLYYVESGSPWPGVLLSGPITIGPTDRAYFDDVLATLNPSAGLLYVVLDEAGPVVTSRTYNLEPGGATFGQGIPAIAFDNVASPDAMILPMVHTEPGRFHTNLGLVHAAGGNLRLRVQAYNASGTLIGTKNYDVSAAWRQVNDVFDDMGLGDQQIYGGWLRVEHISGSGFWTCYASVVDDLTNDPTYVSPAREINIGP
ncbi:MAG: hypothetical protein V2I67_09205 [Thermoanaerobaculales bacterium]|jgi:hypothetical protein|nr:hypothetical protein [Thermoanaerobaculales bacterium]